MAQAPAQNGQPRMEELVPNLNNYVRGRLAKSETLTFADCARALASVKPGDAASSTEIVGKVVPRLTLYGALPPSILPVLLSIRTLLDLPKTGDRKLLRIVNYLIQLASGEGSAGTVVPFSPLVGQAPPVRATDQFEYEDLSKLWADVLQDNATHYQRAAAFRTLSALARASMTTDCDDTTLIGHLMAATATTLDRAEAARRKKLPFFGSSKKGREMDRRQTLERVSAQRVALAAARVGLPRVVLSMKIAPRAFPGVNSPDSLCARHSLALASLVARDNPHMYIEQMSGLLNGSLQIFKTTGSLSNVDEAAAVAPAPTSAGDGTAGLPAAFKPLRPAKDVLQERSANLTDAWARVYLARGCGAVVHAGGGRGGSAELFWQILTICACCDKSTIVTLESIKALVGAPYPHTLTLKPSGVQRSMPLDERKEGEDGLLLTAGWQVLLAHAEDEVPGAVPQMAALQAVAKQFTVSRTLKAVQESASLKRLASMSSEVSSIRSEATPTLMATLVQRLLACLGQMSNALVCSATRAVCVLAEARGRALAAARTLQERAAVMGNEEAQQLMRRLEERMRAIAADPEFSPHQRGKAMEALLWFQPLPGRSGGLTPQEVLQWMSLGGGTVAPIIRAIFCDPWPMDCIMAFLTAVLRRLCSCPAAAEYLLSLANAVVGVCPSRVRPEYLHQMWDTCLRANSVEVKLAAVKACLDLLSGPLPAICAPPSAAAPEVKALASREEMGRVALARTSAWWLGENINFAANEFAWHPRLPPPHMLKGLTTADALAPGQLAAAAVAENPLLAMVLVRLQRAMIGGPWDLRTAAAQAIGKIAVRSGEPFRVQSYSMLASTRQDSRSSGSSSSGGDAPGRVATGPEAGAGAGVGQVADPLGVAASVGPALDVLDQMYSSEIVVEELIAKFGPNRKTWPKPLLKTLLARNAALAAAICERVCFVPRDLFWPLGEAAKQLLMEMPEETAAEKAAKKKKKAEEKAAAKAEAAAAGEGGEAASTTGEDHPKEEKESEEEKEEEEEEEEDPWRRRFRSYGSEISIISSPRKDMLDKLKGWDYNPDDEAYQGGGQDHSDYAASRDGGDDDDDSVVDRQQGTVLYDFTPEEEDEVAVMKGDKVEVAYEVPGWLQIVTSSGARGLVPSTYVHIHEEEDEDGSDTLSLASRGFGETQADATADYNSFLARTSMRLRTRVSDADSTAGGSPTWYGRSSTSGYRGRRASEQLEESEDEGEVDLLVVGQQMGRVGQEDAAVDKALEQVSELEATSRSGGLFNQPQYLNLKEQLTRSTSHLETMEVSGEARKLRRQVRDKALRGLERLESVRRSVMNASGSPAATPRYEATPRSPGDGAGYGSSRQPSTGLGRQSVGGGGGGEPEVYNYTPSQANVLFAFDAEAEGELSVATGEEVWVEAEIDGWYSVYRERDGARGLVPASYVELQGFS